jgi:hypothetical protein
VLSVNALKMRFTLPVLLRHWSLRRGRDKVTYAGEEAFFFFFFYHIIIFFFSSLRRVGYLLFVKLPESSGTENDGLRPLLFISFQFNLKFLFDRLRSPAIG